MLKLPTLILSTLTSIFKKPMLTYTTRHRLLWKPMSYSKKYIKKEKKKEENSSNKCVLLEQVMWRANEQAKYSKKTNWLSLGFVHF